MRSLLFDLTKLLQSLRVKLLVEKLDDFTSLMPRARALLAAGGKYLNHRKTGVKPHLSITGQGPGT